MEGTERSKGGKFVVQHLGLGFGLFALCASGSIQKRKSFAGTMPVNPETCDIDGDMAVLHIQGKLDYIIDYDEDWEWKDGEMEGVGTMSNIPGMIDYWAQKLNCQKDDTHSHLFSGDEVEHIVHSDCNGDGRVEHYGMEAQEHSWPNEVDGTATYRLMWNFLSDFTN